MRNIRKIVYNLLGIAIICSLCIYEGRGLVHSNIVDYNDLISDAAQSNAVHPALITAIIHAESNFDPLAVSRVGAMGLMQIVPSTQRYLGLKNAFDPKQNVDAGSRYLRELLDRFRGNVIMAVAAYNAGPGAVARHAGIPPYKETRNYVKKVLAYYKHYKKAFSSSVLMS